MSVQLVASDLGIKFFNTPEACITGFEKNDWMTKVISFVQSFGTFLSYLATKVSLFWNQVELQMERFFKVQEGASKKRLVVCIHGLNDNPSQFKKAVDEMQRFDLSDTHIFTPRVLERGNAPLDNMVAPIVEEIAKWSKTSSEGELVLIGVSNGGRIARAVEAKIARSESHKNIKKLRLVSIVGACRGSYLANIANQISCLSRWFVSSHILDEMPVESDRNKQLDAEWHSAQPYGPEREYTFFAAPHDIQVPDYDSTLMSVPHKNANYAIVPGHGHNSVVDAVAPLVARIIFGDIGL